MRRWKPYRLLLAVCLTALAIPAVAAPSAMAWTTNAPPGGGGLPTTFTYPGPMAMSISSLGQPTTIDCTTSTLRGAFGGPATTAWLNDPSLGGQPFRPEFAGCTLSSPPNNAVTIGCAQSVQAHATAFASDITTLHLRILSCSISVASSGCTMNLQGNGPLGRAMVAGYHNGTTQLQAPGSGQTMLLSWNSCPFLSPATGSGPARMTIPVAAMMHWKATSTPAPFITP